MLSKTLERLRFGGLHARLVTLFVGLCGSVLILFSIVLYQTFVHQQQKEFDTALSNYAVDLAVGMSDGSLGGLAFKRIPYEWEEKEFPFALRRTVIQIRGGTGEPLGPRQSGDSLNLPLSAADIEALHKGQRIFKTLQVSSSPYEYRLLTYLLPKRSDKEQILQIAAPMNLLERQKHGLLLFFCLSIPIALLIAGVGGWYVSQSAMSPVSAIIAKTRDITHHDISARVPVPQFRDEIRLLAETLNDLLDRLSRAFRGQEVFVADASHQIKTPLAVLRAEIDSIRPKAKRYPEMSDFVDSVSQEVDYLSRLVENLLLLARADTGAAGLSLSKVRVDELMLEAIGRFGTLAKKKGLKISVNLRKPDGNERPDTFEVLGDSDLIRCVNENLIENAIKYSAEKNVVEVELGDKGDAVELVVRDHGVGIHPENHARIFERFYRLNTARDNTSGSGLGLAIAKRIVDIHGGDIAVESSPGTGSCFRVVFRKQV